MKIRISWLLVGLMLLASHSGMGAKSSVRLFTSDSRVNIAGTLVIGPGGSAASSTIFDMSYFTSADCSGGTIAQASGGTLGTYTFYPNTQVQVSAAGVYTIADSNAVNTATVNSAAITTYDNDSDYNELFTACLPVACASNECVGSGTPAVNLP